jgi:hypothetical protein
MPTTRRLHPTQRVSAVPASSPVYDLAAIQKADRYYLAYGLAWRPNTPVAATNPRYKLMVMAVQGQKCRFMQYGDSRYGHNYSPQARRNYLTRSAGIRDAKGLLTKNNRLTKNYWARKTLWAKNSTQKDKTQ